MNIKKIDKPWGHEIIWAQTENYVAKIINIYSGSRLSLQYHEKKEETVYVLLGKLRIWESEDDESFKDYCMGSVFHVKPGKIHRFGNASENNSITTLIEVSTPYLDDVIRILDDYKR